MIFDCAAELLANGYVPSPETKGVVSPGIVGFLAIFGVVAATVVLMFSMTRKIRGIDHRERLREREERTERVVSGGGDHTDGQRPDSK